MINSHQSSHLTHGKDLEHLVSDVLSKGLAVMPAGLGDRLGAVEDEENVELASGVDVTDGEVVWGRECGADAGWA